jgi:hypothetical protein
MALWNLLCIGDYVWSRTKLGHCHSAQNLLKMVVFQLVVMLTSVSLSIICSLSSYRFEHLYLYVSRLGGVVVSVFATGPED